MKSYLFKNRFDKISFFVTLIVIFLYFSLSFLFKSKDTARLRNVPPAVPLQFYFDEELTQPVQFPFNNNRSADIFTVYTLLPNVMDNSVIELQGKYHILTAALNANVFFVSEIPSFAGIKTYAGRNLCFIPLRHFFSNKVITLNISLQKNPYGASISDVKLTTMATYINTNVSQCFPSYLLAALLFLCSLFSLNAFLCSYLYQKKRMAVDFAISVETFLVSLSIVMWIVTNYDVLGVVVGNPTAVGIVNYLSFTSMPIFFTSFLCSINNKHQKTLRGLQIIAEANFILQFVVFVAGLFDLTQMLFLTHLIDLFAVIMTLGVMFDFASIKKYSLEQKFLCVGSAVFALFAVVSMILFVFGTDMNYMLLITMGFFILFGMHMVTSFLKLSISLQEHAKLLESERNSYRDQLTNLGNRRLYYRMVAKLEAMGFDDEMNFIMIDVNGLKVTNDTYGHDAGDELLVGTAVCMTESFPDAELLCRMGGDEFFIIIKEKEIVLEKRLKRFLSYAENWNGKHIKSISMSYGIANHKKFPGFTIAELEKAADEEMYKFKTDYYKNKHELEEVLQGRR